MNDKEVSIGMGEYAVAKSPAILLSSGIGSCLVICLYDAANSIGAMGHAMMPYESEEKHVTEGAAHYVDRGIKRMLKEMKKAGCKEDKIIAKLVGGASMFKNLTAYSRKIGEDNVESAKKLLEDMDIEIKTESTGGTVGRNVEFNVMNGVVTVTSKI
jgi:chemotaxis protein CheD